MLLLRGSNWMCCLTRQEKFLGRKQKIFMKTSLLSLWISLTWAAPCSQCPSEIHLARRQQGSFQTLSLKLGRRAPCDLEAVVPMTQFLRSACMQARQSESAACLQTPTSWESYLVLLSQKKNDFIWWRIWTPSRLTSRFQTKSGKVNLSKFDLSWAALKMTSSYCEFLNSDHLPILIFMFSSIFLVTHCQCMD